MSILTRHSVRIKKTGTIPAILMHGEYPELEEVRLQVAGRASGVWKSDCHPPDLQRVCGQYAMARRIKYKITRSQKSVLEGVTG